MSFLNISIGKDDKNFCFIKINHFPSSFQTSDHDTKNLNNAILFRLETVANEESLSFLGSFMVFLRLLSLVVKNRWLYIKKEWGKKNPLTST